MVPDERRGLLRRGRLPLHHGQGLQHRPGRGNRVSTEEVAAVLRGIPGIANAAVVALDDPVWTTRLEAFVVFLPGERLADDAIDRWARERLAAYKVPRRYHVLDELPTESAGKASLLALRELAQRGH